jgi:hypothetical protein
VLEDGYVLPVVCGYPYLPEDLTPNPYLSGPALTRKYNRQAAGFRACDVIMPSMHFVPHGNWRPARAVREHGAPVVTGALAGSHDSSPQGTSLGDVARAHRKQVSTQVIEEMRRGAAGFNELPFRYCDQNKRCFDASALLPASAWRNADYQTYPTGLFQYEVPYQNSMAVIEAHVGMPSESPSADRDQILRSSRYNRAPPGQKCCTPRRQLCPEFRRPW